MENIPTLASVGDSSSRLLFYPSSGSDARWPFDYDYDIFVFSDHCKWGNTPEKLMKAIQKRFTDRLDIVFFSEKKCVFKYGVKIGFVLFEDNNIAIRKIKNSGRTISAFVGKCDGCLEGGNYECVNESPFLDKVMNLMDEEGMMYVTTHSSLLYPRKMNNLLYIAPRPYQELILGGVSYKTQDGAWDGWYERDSNGRHLFGGKKSFIIKRHTPTVHKYQIGKITLSVEHDTIADHLDELDAAIVSFPFITRYLFRYSDRLPKQDRGKSLTRSDNIHEFPKYFFSPSKKDGWTAEKSLRELLHKSDENKWSSVGTIAFGEGQHSQFKSILQEWSSEYPKSLRLFHMDSGDYKGLITDLGE